MEAIHRSKPERSLRSCVCLSAATVSMLAMSTCAPTTTHQITSPFDLAKASAIHALGNNKISGSALIRQQGGGVVTCAGNEVRLIPVTPYTTERMRLLYGSDERGYRSIWQGSPVFQPDPPDYYTAQRVTTGDPQGMFEFESVPDGAYYLMTTVTWSAGSYPQGGALMQKVLVSGGEEKKIVLSP